MSSPDIIPFVMGIGGIALLIRLIVLYAKAGGGYWLVVNDPVKARIMRRACIELLAFAGLTFALAWYGVL